MLGLLAVVSAILLAVGAFLAVEMPGSARADGVVVDLVGHPVVLDANGETLQGSGTGFAPAVEFTPTGGGPVRFLAALPSDPPRFAVGDHVPVRYHPADPRRADRDDFWSLYLAAVIVGGIGALLALAVGTLGTVLAVLRRRT